MLFKGKACPNSPLLTVTLGRLQVRSRTRAHQGAEWTSHSLTDHCFIPLYSNSKLNLDFFVHIQD